MLNITSLTPFTPVISNDHTELIVEVCNCHTEGLLRVLIKSWVICITNQYSLHIFLLNSNHVAHKDWTYGVIMTDLVNRERVVTMILSNGIVHLLIVQSYYKYMYSYFLQEKVCVFSNDFIQLNFFPLQFSYNNCLLPLKLTNQSIISIYNLTIKPRITKCDQQQITKNLNVHALCDKEIRK